MKLENEQKFKKNALKQMLLETLHIHELTLNISTIKKIPSTNSNKECKNENLGRISLLCRSNCWNQHNFEVFLPTLHRL